MNQLYRRFIRFLVALGIENGLTKASARKAITARIRGTVLESFYHKELGDQNDQETEIALLYEDCIRVIEAYGPSREYYTLLGLLRSISVDFVSKSKRKTGGGAEWVSKFEEKVAALNQNIPKPPLFNMLLESRALVEWTSIYGLYPFIPKRIQGGDHPVLLIPPYLGDDSSTSFVRRYLSAVGFTTYKWDQGVNMIKSHYIPRLEEKLDDIYQAHGEKVSIVGWSGGGLFGKIMANRHPDQVAQIVTIGSPVWGVMDMKTPLNGILEFFRGKSMKEKNKRFIEELEPIPDLPVTCIYTKTDGVIPWKHCIEAESYRKDIKNIEVFGSHSGLGANVSVLMSTARSLYDNLKGMDGETIPSRWERMLYPAYWTRRKAFSLRK